MDDENESNRNGTLQEQLKKIPCLMQQLTGDRENLKTKNALLLQFVRGLSVDLNDCQSGQKKYRVREYIEILRLLIYFYSYSKHIQNNNNYY